MSEKHSDTRMRERPDDLPEFTTPPLVEVVIDTQFEAIPEYKQIYAGEVWRIFRDRFPNVEEHQALTPSFETFGPPSKPQFNFQISQNVVPTRYWFLSDEGDHLIQFQADRFVRNWRKHHNVEFEYPRFEMIIDSFSKEFSTLSQFLNDRFSYELQVNQCEVRYINNIPIDPKTGFQVENFFRFGDFGDFAIDDFHFRFRRTIRDEHESPIFRLTCDCGIAYTSAGGTTVKLEIFARGAPMGPSLKETLQFCLRARVEIVRLFADITTEQAHQLWGRLK